MKAPPLAAGVLVVLLAGMSPQASAESAQCGFNGLTLKDAQTGFAGTTGTVWTIKPDCSYEVSRFVENNVSAPHRRGRLSPEQQAKLSSVLSEKAITTLPARLGEPVEINARRLSIEYGGKVAVLELVGGAGSAESLKTRGPNEPARRLLDIADTIKSMTGATE